MSRLYQKKITSKKKYRFRMTKTFKKKFEGLSSVDKKATKETFEIFKKDPFDPTLKPHKLNYIKKFGVDTFSIWVRGNLRVIFTVIEYANSNIADVVSLDIGSHDIYENSSEIVVESSSKI